MDGVNLYGDDWPDGTEEPGFRNLRCSGSEKIGASAGFMRTDGARVRLLNREGANLQYFDGER